MAEQKGLGYQTFMKMLLHEALGREEKKTAVEAVRGTADTHMSTDGILALTRGDTRVAKRRK